MAGRAKGIDYYEFQRRLCGDLAAPSLSRLSGGTVSGAGRCERSFAFLQPA